MGLQTPDTENGGTNLKPFLPEEFCESIQKLINLSFAQKETEVQGLILALGEDYLKESMVFTLHVIIHQNKKEDLPALTAKITEADKEGIKIIFPANGPEKKKNDPQNIVKKGLPSTILNQIGEAILCTSLEGEITYINPAAETMHGFTLKEGLGKPITELIKTSVSNAVSPAFMVEGEGENARSIERIITRPDGSEIEVRSFTTPIKDEYGEVIGSVGISADVTVEKQISR